MDVRVSAVLLTCQTIIPDKAQNEEASSKKNKVEYTQQQIKPRRKEVKLIEGDGDFVATGR